MPAPRARQTSRSKLSRARAREDELEYAGGSFMPPAIPTTIEAFRGGGRPASRARARGGGRDVERPRHLVGDPGRRRCVRGRANGLLALPTTGTAFAIGVHSGNRHLGRTIARARGATATCRRFVVCGVPLCRGARGAISGAFRYEADERFGVGHWNSVSASAAENRSRDRVEFGLAAGGDVLLH